MNDHSKQTLFSTEPTAGGSEPIHGAPLKAWVTPKVITSTFVDDETASSVAAGGDAASHS